MNLKNLFLIIIFLASLKTTNASIPAPTSISCTLDNLKLVITTYIVNNQKHASWLITSPAANNQEEILATGSGHLQDEIGAIDAFSSYDDNSAISYKGNKVAFVLPNNQAIIFSNCSR